MLIISYYATLVLRNNDNILIAVKFALKKPQKLACSG